jgi:sugar phosphate isomerase/epimerase
LLVRFEKLSEKDKAEFFKAVAQFNSRNLPKTSEDQQRRVKQDADRIQALVKLAAPYGSKVELYNHNGWFGMEENQLAIIGRLKELGVTDVGMVYNFSHARDELHDDSKNFPELWEKMKTHVVAVNITGMHWEGQEVYPSQGDSELEMMRTIQQSGWRGPIGLIAEKGGDAETTLHNYILGLDWLAAELKRSGSGGNRPFSSTTVQGPKN